MGKTASLTIRISEPLKRRIESRAAREHRSLSAQVEHELSQVLAAEQGRGPVKAGKLLGRYPGGRLPTTEDFELARKVLWARLSPARR